VRAEGVTGEEFHRAYSLPGWMIWAGGNVCRIWCESGHLVDQRVDGRIVLVREVMCGNVKWR
jgi:hypothetical protein